MASDEEIGIRLRLRGGQETATGLKKTAAEIRAIGQASKDVDGYVSRFNSSLNQGLRTAAHAGGVAVAATTTAIGGLAAAAGFLGIKTAASFEQTDIAFGVLLKSTDKAKVMIGDLRNFAENSPFELKDVNAGAQRLLAMGFAAKDILPIMKTVGNGAAAGIVPLNEGMNRVTYALGQMKAAGRVQGDELRQLEEMGIGVREALSKGFNIPMDQLPKAIREGKLEADKAIPIILGSIDANFGGMMDAQSKSWAGMWSRFKEVAQNNLGDITRAVMDPFKPTFERLSTRADMLAKQGTVIAQQWRAEFQRINTTMGANTGIDGMVLALDRVLGADGDLRGTFDSAKLLFNDISTIFTQSFLPAAASLAQVLPAPLGMIRSTIGFMADHPTAAKVFFEGMAVAIATWQLATLLTGVAIGLERIGVALGVLGVGAAAGKGGKGGGGGLAGLGAGFAAVRTPVTALMALTLGLGYALDRLLEKMGGGRLGLRLFALAFLGPVGAAAGFSAVIRNLGGTIDSLKNKAQGAYIWILMLKKVLSESGNPIARALGGAIPGAAPSKVQGMATGGVVTSGGVALVGEQGPELISASPGATVRPLQGDEAKVSAGNVFNINVSGADALHAERIADVLVQAISTRVARA